MKRVTLIACVVCLLGGAAACLAIDRDAQMIDTIGVEGSSPSDTDVATVSLWGEVGLARPYDQWALLVGIASGQESPATGSNSDFLYGGVGVKYYLTSLTSVSVVGTFGKYSDVPSDPDFRMLTFRGKHRLMPADEAISPFVTASLSVVDGEAYPDAEQWLTFTAGCEFFLTDTLSLVMEGGYSDHEGGKDGPVGSLAFSCYWD